MAIATLATAMTACGGKAENAEGQNATEQAAQELAEGEEGEANPEGVQEAVNEMGVRISEADNIYKPGMNPAKPTVIDFNATWCVPCRKFEPVFNQAAAAFRDKVDFVSIDIDKNPQTAAAFGVESIPTVVLIKTDGSMQKYVGTEEIATLDKFSDKVKALL